jgi:hypothetical protein
LSNVPGGVAASDRGTGGGQVLLSLGVVVSRLVQVGVLGTSYWVAEFHLPALRSHAGARVRAICGRDRRRAQALAEQHDVPVVYTDYRGLTLVERRGCERARCTHDRAPTGCCTSARRTSPEPDCDTPDRQW